MPKAVIYARYSAGSDQTDQSIEGQVRICKKYMKEKGLRCTKIYADRHISGTTDRRPEFQQMIKDASSGKFDALVLYSTDRFARNKYDSAVYKKKLRDAGVTIYYAAETIPEGPEGILLESLMEGWAQYYSEELSRKIKRGLTDSAMKGRYNGGSIPLGYRPGENRQLEVVPAEAEAIRTVYRMFVEGASQAACARFLNENGFTTCRGGDFKPHTIKVLLSNPKYIGIYKYGDIEIPGGVPAIVSKEIFDMAQKRFDDTKRNMEKAPDVYRLSGKLYCGICGAKMRGTAGTSKTGKRYNYYKCPNGCHKLVRRDGLETLVADIVRKTFNEPQELEKVADKIFTLQQKEHAQKQASDPLRKELTEVKKGIANIVKVVESGRATDSLLERLDDLEAKKCFIESEISAPDNTILSKEAIEAGLQAMLKGFSFDDPDTSITRILKAFVNKIILRENDILVYFNITGDSGALKTSDLIEFSQDSLWWTKHNATRTLIPVPDGFIIISPLEYIS